MINLTPFLRRLSRAHIGVLAVLCGLAGLLPSGAIGQANNPHRAACEARINACMPRTACPAWVKEQPSNCWVNNCSFKAYLTWGAGNSGDPLKQGDVYAASVDSPFKPDPRSENWRIVDCEVPASAQAIAALPMPQAPAAAGTVALAPVIAPQAPAAPVAAAAAPAAAQGAVAAAGLPGPRAACGKRVFLALAKCMAEHCKQAQYTGHADCAGFVQADGTTAPGNR